MRKRCEGLSIAGLALVRRIIGAKPHALPALQTDAQPLRFLDYLIHEPGPAVTLHDAGIYVQVPSPARFVEGIICQTKNDGYVSSVAGSEDGI